jgi:ubiquitin-conjugating enzyme E2 W
MAGIAPRRLTKELKELHQGTPVGIALLAADDFQAWRLSIQVMGDSLYKDQVFAVQFRFTPQYPIASPEVTFVVDDTYKPPLHPVSPSVDLFRVSHWS